MNRILFIRFLGLAFFVGGYVRATTLACPAGTRLLKTRQNKSEVESCVKRKKPCPSLKNPELVTSEVDKTASCDVYHGTTHYKHPDGSELILNYQNGKLHGKAMSYSSTAVKLSEENFKMGKKEGKQEAFYPSGKKKSEENYLLGLKKGEQIAWYENGELQSHIEYLDGRPSGTWTFWYLNGQKRMEYMYGMLGWEGLYRDWYSNGKLHAAAQFLNGQLEGSYSLYYSNGKPLSERKYVKGTLEGVFDEWSESGEKIASSRYVAGKFKEWIEFPEEKSTSSETPPLQRDLSSVLKADLDGNGYIDEVVSSNDSQNQTRVRFKERDKVVKEVTIPKSQLDIYSARSSEGQFGEPASLRDGLVAWGNEKETKLYLYDYESETFLESSYPAEIDI
ncbi:MAG: toxin-antitoxin system YwqK family antitoxin [Proteobacteria bacterium]|nr:toxin-antitoxin system YwqK family antitoxin [Pseudomonadota bacterium]NBY20221.1 toxin-antitoxin system YwqK family antitoxin [bacterium]